MHVVVGDDALERALKDEDELCMDLVYDAIDWFRKAIIETKEIEVHQICNSVIVSAVVICLLIHSFICLIF